MPLPPASAGRGRWVALGVVMVLSLGLVSALVLNSKKPSKEPSREPSKEPAQEKPATEERIVATEEGMASWYPVPPNSVTKQRAGKDELTAAHNRLPFGTKVRVTHLKNGKNVIVRITDRGYFQRHGLIDLCKEAAEQLDMIREGSARVRLDVLSDDNPETSPAR